jgi:predicted ribosome quality control (RQC) complex YloA/Tae2 family protein
MSFDTLIMQSVTGELQRELTGAPVQRVYEPNRGEVIIHLYTEGRQPGLLFSVDSRYARVHLTEKRYKSIETPSPFCMLLRKYLIGGRAVSFNNPPWERILEIDFDPPEGMPAVRLVAEIMGRRSNLILVNGNGTILGAAKIASWDKNPKRAIMAGEKYLPVPSQEKLNPLEMEPVIFANALQELIAMGKTPEQALIDSVAGVSPLTARELLFRSGWDACLPGAAAQNLFGQVRNLFAAAEKGLLKPVLLPGPGLYAAMPLLHLQQHEQKEYESANKMLDHYYAEVIRDEREALLKSRLEKAVENRLSALDRKQRELENDLLAATNAPQYRLYGELLLAYGDQVKRGAETVVLPNIYAPDETVTVPVNPSKTASSNAQKYFTLYRKAKKGQEQIKRHLQKTRAEVKYCDGLLYTIENSDESALEEIRQEMIDAGYIKEKRKGRRRSAALPQPLSFKASSGRTILVGRNNRQNDYITFKAAVRRDTWLHVRQLPGSHVILKEAPFPPPQEDIEEAAFLAAYFSRARESGAAAVDYTEVRHVRRRPGGKPGFVFYENFETITVNPRDEERQKQFNLLPWPDKGQVN